MRALLVICLAASVAVAAPKYTHRPATSSDPGLRAAERSWAAAEAERDPAKQADAWDATAAAFARVVEAGTLPRADLALAATAAVSAIKNALDVDPRANAAPDDPVDASGTPPKPRPIPAREQRLLHVIEVAQRFDASSPDAVGLELVRANILRRHAHFDEAIPLLRDIVDHHRDHETAEFAATLLLDTYNLQHDYDRMLALVDALRADVTFLAAHPDLASTVAYIHTQRVRKAAETTEKAARDANDRALYDRAAEQYLALADGPDADELLYNAAVCFQAAGSLDRARETVRSLLKRFPKSRLAERGLARLVVIERQAARYADAAAAAEIYAARYAGEKDALDVALDAAGWRIALGELDAAARDVDLIARTFVRARTVQPALALQLVEALLAAGRRHDAARRAATLAAAPGLQLRHARTIADAACPVALVDGLCTRPRDAKLLAAARHELAELRGEDVATLAALDLDLEDVLANRATARATELVTDAFRELAARSQQPEVQVIAHARLGRLAAHAGNAAEAATQLHACSAVASAALVAPAWIVTCEHELGIVGVPEHTPPPIAVAAPPQIAGP